LKSILKFICMLWACLIGLAVVMVIFVGPFSADTLQQSRLACVHSVEVLTGHEYTIISVKNGKTTDTFNGFAEGKSVMCKTSLVRMKIIELRIGSMNRVNDLEKRDRDFNPRLDYFHNH